MFILGPALAESGLDFLRVQSRHKDGHVRITSAVVYSEADAARLREWCAHAPVAITIEPNALRVATAEEIAEHERTLENI